MENINRWKILLTSVCKKFYSFFFYVGGKQTKIIVSGVLCLTSSLALFFFNLGVILFKIFFTKTLISVIVVLINCMHGLFLKLIWGPWKWNMVILELKALCILLFNVWWNLLIYTINFFYYIVVFLHISFCYVIRYIFMWIILICFIEVLLFYLTEYSYILNIFLFLEYLI